MKLVMDLPLGLCLRRKAYVAAVEGSHEGVILDPRPTRKNSRRPLCACEVGGTNILVKERRYGEDTTTK